MFFYSKKSGPIEIILELPSLSCLKLNDEGTAIVNDEGNEPMKVDIVGTGDAYIHNIDRSDLTFTISGSGDIKADGKAEVARLTIAGSGDIDTSFLNADEVYTNIHGSGDAIVTAHKILEANVFGSGDIYYQGNPHVSKRVYGSGSITRLR